MFREIEEEHGELDKESQIQEQRNVRSRFLLFWMVVLILHILMLLFAIIYLMVTNNNVGEKTKKYWELFGICLNSNSDFLSLPFSAKLNGTEVLLHSDPPGNFTCVSVQQNSIVYSIMSAIALSLVMLGYFSHYLADPNSCWLQYLDVALVVVVYAVNIAGPFLTVDGAYTIPALMGPRVCSPSFKY